MNSRYTFSAVPKEQRKLESRTEVPDSVVPFKTPTYARAAFLAVRQTAQRGVAVELYAAQRALSQLQGVKLMENPAPADAVPAGIDLDRLEDMGRRQMALDQAAPLLRVPLDVLLDACRRYPAVREAYEHGLSRGVYEATGCIMDAIERGEIGAARYLLERKGGWTPPATDRGGPSVHVHGPGQVITIDASHVQELGARQVELLSGPTEAEGSAVPVDPAKARRSA